MILRPCRIRVLSRLIPSSQAVTALKMKTMVLASPQVCRHFSHLLHCKKRKATLPSPAGMSLTFFTVCGSQIRCVYSRWNQAAFAAGLKSVAFAVGPWPQPAAFIANIKSTAVGPIQTGSVCSNMPIHCPCSGFQIHSHRITVQWVGSASKTRCTRKFLFKVKPILARPFVSPAWDTPHPLGLPLNNTLLFYANLLVLGRNEQKCSPKKRCWWADGISSSSCEYIVSVMDQITIKTPKPKCRLIEFIDWRESQSCWYFRPLLWTSTVAPF